MDHLLIHCKYDHILWSEVLRLFGVRWVMPKNVVSLLSAWWNWLGSHTSNVWNMVPTCLMWLIWKECSARTFEETFNSSTHLQQSTSYLKNFKNSMF